jgi:hypothetical protein
LQFCNFFLQFFFVGVVGVKRDAADRVAVVGWWSINTKDSGGAGGHFGVKMV